MIAAVGPLAIAGLLVPVRDEPLVTGTALVLMASMAAAAAVLAGFAGASAGVVTAAFAFDFFFTRPYLALKIDSTADLWTILVLVTAAVGTAAVAAKRRAARASAQDRCHNQPNQSSHIERVVRLMAQGTHPDDLISAVQAELTVLLTLQRCQFTAGGLTGRRPRLGRNPTVSSGGLGSDPIDLQLPVEGLELPVEVGSTTLGVFMMDPTPGASVPTQHRVVAVILTDHLAAALGPAPRRDHATARRNARPPRPDAASPWPTQTRLPLGGDDEHVFPSLQRPLAGPGTPSVSTSPEVRGRWRRS